MNQPSDSNCQTENSQPSPAPISDPSKQDEKAGATPELPLQWKNHLSQIWPHSTEKVKQLFPLGKTAAQNLLQSILQSLTVSEAEIAEILKEVRAELPTTEVILIGKTQAGKSSIVRGLTGVSAAIVGQGFRPHTQHTQRYAYPSNDLPLMIFTDSVGLGDVGQNTEEIIQEFLGNLSGHSRSKILIVTVKINDFATDTLIKVVQQLRKNHANIPCLLVVTCLHELYPPGVENHPIYPPEYPEIQTAFAQLQDVFGKLCERAILIDFTLEEDGYTPVFYGLEKLRDTLAEMLPKAEAQAIYQLLDKNLDENANKQLGNLYRDVSRRYILAFSVITATLAAVPLPFATMPVLTALQVSMVGLLGKLYGQTLTPSQAGGVVSAIAGGFLAQVVGRELVKFVPVLGSAIAASWAAAYTWALGEGACVYFGDLMGGKKPDPQKIELAMQEAFKAAQERFKQN